VFVLAYESGTGPIAVDGGEVFWLRGNNNTTTVSKVSVTGGPVTTLVGGGFPMPYGIVVDGANVYWTDAGASLRKVSRGGGPVTTLAACDQANWPLPLSVDSTSVYWADLHGNLQKTPISGGATTTLATAMGVFEIHGGNAYFLGKLGVMQVPVGGGTPTKLVGITGPTNRALEVEYSAANATSMFWIAAGGPLMQAPFDGGPVVTLVTTSAPFIAGMAADDTNVYVATGTAIVKVPIAGGAPTTVVTIPKAFLVTGLAVDATNVYWMIGGPVVGVGTLAYLPK
jgi:hypothetical protein